MSKACDILKEVVGKNLIINSLNIENKILSYSVSAVDAGALVEAKISMDFNNKSNSNYCSVPFFNSFEATVKHQGETIAIEDSDTEAKTIIALIGIRIGLHNHNTI